MGYTQQDHWQAASQNKYNGHMRHYLYFCWLLQWLPSPQIISEVFHSARFQGGYRYSCREWFSTGIPWYKYYCINNTPTHTSHSCPDFVGCKLGNLQLFTRIPSCSAYCRHIEWEHKSHPPIHTAYRRGRGDSSAGIGCFEGRCTDNTLENN